MMRREQPKLNIRDRKTVVHSAHYWVGGFIPEIKNGHYTEAGIVYTSCNARFELHVRSRNKFTEGPVTCLRCLAMST